MNIHKNARLTQLGRERIVRLAAEGRALSAIAVCVGFPENRNPLFGPML